MLELRVQGRGGSVYIDLWERVESTGVVSVGRR